MKDLADRVREALRRKEKEYKHIFLDAKKNELRLVRSRFKLVPQNRFYLEVYDGKLFGLHVPESRTKNWHYVGDL